MERLEFRYEALDCGSGTRRLSAWRAAKVSRDLHICTGGRLGDGLSSPSAPSTLDYRLWTRDLSSALPMQPIDMGADALDANDYQLWTLKCDRDGGSGSQCAFARSLCASALCPASHGA